MDFQKLESLSKGFAAVVIPIVLLVVGQSFSSATKEREIESKFVEMATAVLNNDPGDKPSNEVKSLRRWAVAVIDKFSGVPMPRETADALIQSTPLPVAPSSREAAVGPWGVVFGGDTSLESAKHEVTVTAKRMSLSDARIYLRNKSYRSVAVFADRSAAEEALGKARVVRSDAYLVDMSKWCPIVIERQGFQECNKP